MPPSRFRTAPHDSLSYRTNKQNSGATVDHASPAGALPSLLSAGPDQMTPVGGARNCTVSAVKSEHSTVGSRRQLTHPQQPCHRSSRGGPQADAAPLGVFEEMLQVPRADYPHLTSHNNVARGAWRRPATFGVVDRNPQPSTNAKRRDVGAPPGSNKDHVWRRKRMGKRLPETDHRQHRTADNQLTSRPRLTAPGTTGENQTSRSPNHATDPTIQRSRSTLNHKINYAGPRHSGDRR